MTPDIMPYNDVSQIFFWVKKPDGNRWKSRSPGRNKERLLLRYMQKTF